MAVSEIVKARGHRASGTVGVARGVSAAAGALTPLALALAGIGCAHAAPPAPNQLPSGGRIVAGSAVINQSVAPSGATMNISQSSQRATIDWQSFNLGSQAQVNFLQPSSSSATLNRVLDSNPSQIFGHISAPGQIFLVNPNGIYFAAGASVDVGGLVATTHSIANDDFMAGNLVFNRNGATGSIINEGELKAALGGYIALLAPEVRNRGVIVAQMGTVVLAAGEAYELQFDGNNTLANIRVQPATIKALVDNGNAVHAPGGVIILSAQAASRLQGGVVNNSGTLEATGLVDNGGVIRLSASDSVRHSGSIMADAAPGSAGNGGTVTLIADLANPDSQSVIAGSISARGGDRGGNGGFVETSAARLTIGDQAHVTTAAAMGLAGTWLLDPADFTIAASGGDITGASLGTNLGAGNVTIASSSGSAGTSGNVNVNDVVAWSANKLTLNAQDNININANLNGSGSASLALQYGQGAVAAGNSSTYTLNNGAQVNLPAGNNFSTLLGSDGTTTNYTVITNLGAAGSTTGTDLQGISGNLAGNYALGGNIDATATSTWNSNAGFTPVGNASTRFSGTLDGLGHAISNLTINLPTSTDVGLFGQTAAASSVRTLGLVGESITGNIRTGGLAGLNYGTISNIYATGSVSGGSFPVGGLVGRNRGTISNSYATSNVAGGIKNAGGLVGSNYGTISNSYATGNVTGGAYQVGGLVGVNYGSGTVSTSYAIGGVSGSSNVGGLIGLNSGTVNNSYWNTDIYATGIGGGTTTGATGLNTAAMQSAANFSGFTFTATPGASGNNWVMVDADGTLNNAGNAAGATYPMLASEYSININNAHQLQLMAMAPGANYTLTSSINAAATGNGGDVWGSAGFVPVGNASSNFSGSFDGLGNSIANLTINRPGADNVGLFGVAQASVINNLGLINVSITGHNSVGALIGSATVGSASNDYATGQVTGQGNVGGLLGFENTMNLSSSHAESTVTGGSAVGGLIGYTYGGSFSSLNYARGNVTGTGSDIGGLIGHNGFAFNVVDSYASGNVHGGSNVGGLVGNNSAAGNIANSYATGHVTGMASNIGGLVGLNASTVSSSYWNSDVLATGIGLDSGTTTGTTGLTTAQMQVATNFSGFTFTSTPGAAGWIIVNGDGSLNTSGTPGGGTYPMLASEYSTSINNAHQLQLMAMAPGASYTLAANINAAATGTGTDVWGSAGFVPIGNASSQFTGNFDGLGQTLSNLTVSGSSLNNGLFGSVAYATIQGLTLSTVSVGGGTGPQGALAGTVDHATISNVTASNVTVTHATSDPWAGTGGLIGNASNSTLANLAVTGTSVMNNAWHVGGLVGTLANSTLASSSSNANLVNVGYGVGGLIGYSSGSTVSNSTASGNVSGGGYGRGGLIGIMSGGSVLNSSASGNVTNSGSRQTGGLVGNGSGTIDGSFATGAVSSTGDKTGGLSGDFTGTISNSYASGNVTGTTNVGGLVGFNSGSISTSHAQASQVSGTSNVGGLVGTNDTTGNISSSQLAGAGVVTASGSYAGGLVGQNLGSVTTGGVSSASSVTGANFVGGLIGVNGGFSNATASIAQSTVDGTVSLSNSGTLAGGLVGRNFGVISNSNSTGLVTAGINTFAVGGLVGANSGTISNASTNGSSVAAGAGSDAAGTLIGVQSGTDNGSSSTGTVTIGGTATSPRIGLSYTDGLITTACS